MARQSIYNRNYPNQKISKDSMLSLDGLKLTAQYMRRLLDLDVSPNAKLDAIGMLQVMNDHFLRVSKVTCIENLVPVFNEYMAQNEHGPSDLLKLLCSFMHDLLFHADRYRGFNNYFWRSTGADLYLKDHPNFDGNVNDPKYSSQEYHRYYY